MSKETTQHIAVGSAAIIGFILFFYFHKRQRADGTVALDGSNVPDYSSPAPSDGSADGVTDGPSRSFQVGGNKNNLTYNIGTGGCGCGCDQTTLTTGVEINPTILAAQTENVQSLPKLNVLGYEGNVIIGG